MAIKVQIKRLAHGEGLELPAYQSASAAGLDLLAAVDQDMVLPAGGWQLVPTGLAFAIPTGFEGQVRPRSGLAAKSGITVLNSPGTIDADYRGEVKVILINHSQAAYTIKRGERVAQLVIAPVVQAALEEVENLDETERGSGGFGSTGTKG